MKKSAYRKWIFPVLVVFLLVVTFIIRKYKKYETEYSIMQAVIEKLPDYQNEIESWGYQVSVLPKMTEEPEHACIAFIMVLINISVRKLTQKICSCFRSASIMRRSMKMF